MQAASSRNIRQCHQHGTRIDDSSSTSQWHPCRSRWHNPKGQRRHPSWPCSWATRIQWRPNQRQSTWDSATSRWAPFQTLQSGSHSESPPVWFVLTGQRGRSVRQHHLRACSTNLANVVRLIVSEEVARQCFRGIKVEPLSNRHELAWARL